LKFLLSSVVFGSELGVTLALENAPQFGVGNIMTLHWVFTQYPFIRLTYDTANWLAAGESPLTALETLRPYVAYVHLKDAVKDNQSWQFTYPGAGEVPFKEILAKLAQTGYDEYSAFEFLGGANPRSALEKAIRFMKN